MVLIREHQPRIGGGDCQLPHLARRQELALGAEDGDAAAGLREAGGTMRGRMVGIARNEGGDFRHAEGFVDLGSRCVAPEVAQRGRQRLARRQRMAQAGHRGQACAQQAAEDGGEAAEMVASWRFKRSGICSGTTLGPGTMAVAPSVQGSRRPVPMV